MSGLKDFSEAVMRWVLEIAFIVGDNTNNGTKQHRRYMLLACLLCAFCLTRAQSVWNKNFTANMPKLQFSSIVSLDTNYYVLGNSTTLQSPNFETGFIFRLNESGEITDYVGNSDSLTQRTGFLWNTLTKSSDGYLVFSGNGADTGQHLTFGFADINLDTIELLRYKEQNIFSYQGIALTEHPSKFFFVAGVHNIQSSFNANVLLMKIDTNGQKVWEKFYNQKVSDYAKSIIVLKNGNLMLGAERNDLGQPVVKSNTWLLEVDTGGTIVRQWFDPNDSTYVAEGLRQTQDGGFIYGAQKKNYQSGFSSVSYNATIVKMDSNFNKQWTFSGSSYRSIYDGITDIEELPDGNFIAAGHLSYYGTDTALNGYIVKLDINGNVIWERNYRGINESQTLNFLSDIDILPDGGFVAVGQCQKSGATPPQVGWFLKLDSNGCEVENCLVGIDGGQVTDDEGQIQVWPNPASGVVTVMLPDELQDAELKIYDVAGKVVKEFKAATAVVIVDVSDLNKGLYLIIAEKEGKYARAKLVVE